MRPGVAAALETLRAPGFAPRLKPELKFFRAEQPSVVVVATPGGLRHQLYEFECQLAKEMNGERDLDELSRVAGKIVPGANRELLEKFVIQCASLGLLTNLEVPPPVAPVGAGQAPVGTNVDFGEFQSQLRGEMAPPAATPPAATPPAATPAAATPAAATPFDDPDRTSVGEPEPPPAAPEPPAATPEPPDSPGETGNDEEWKHDRVPWYAHPVIVRFRFWGALALVLVILAVIPWPLYVTEDCVVLPVRRVEVRTLIDGIIAEINVDEGSHVKAGDVIARLDDRDLQAQVRQARSEVDRLSANLLKMKRGTRKEEIARAQVEVASRAHDLSFAKVEAERREKLFAQGVGSAEQRDNARRDLELKQIALSQAQAEVRLLRAGFRPEEVAIAEAEVQRAQSDLQFLEKRLSLLAITSPIDGTIMTAKFRDRLHEKLLAGSTVCEVADTSTVRVEIRVPERQIDVVAMGQPTVVKVQSYPLHPFKGKVTFIGTAVEQKDDLRYLRVVTDIENPEGLLREHMTGYGEINTGESRVLRLMLRRFVRYIRVRFLI